MHWASSWPLWRKHVSADAGSIDPEEAQRRASALHLDAGMTVQELNWDEDADPVIRSGIEEVIGGDLAVEPLDEGGEVGLTADGFVQGHLFTHPDDASPMPLVGGQHRSLRSRSCLTSRRATRCGCEETVADVRIGRPGPGPDRASR